MWRLHSWSCVDLVRNALALPAGLDDAAKLCQVFRGPKLGYYYQCVCIQAACMCMFVNTSWEPGALALLCSAFWHGRTASLPRRCRWPLRLAGYAFWNARLGCDTEGTQARQQEERACIAFTKLQCIQ